MARFISRTDGKTIDIQKAFADAYDDTNRRIKTDCTVTTGDINVDTTSLNINAYVGKPTGGNGDFVTARTGNTTFTCTTLPTGITAINTSDIETIRQINSSGTVVATYSRDDKTIICAGTDPTTVTVTGAVFGTTDTIVCITNITKLTRITDGTTYGTIETSGTKKALNVNITDGTNDFPTMDANTRAGFIKLTDGTDDLNILVQDSAFGATSTGIGIFGKYEATPTTYNDGDAAPILLDANGRIVLSSDIEIGAVELKNAATDDRASIIPDNAAAGTPNPLLIGGKYNSAAQTYGDGDAAVLQMDVSGNLKVTGGASSVQAEFTSPSDFIAVFTSSSTLTLSGLPITINDASQIVYVKQTKSANTAATYVAGANGISFAHSSGVITIYQYGATITSLASGDVYEVGINAQRKGFDSSTNSMLSSNLNPVYSRYTNQEAIISAAQDLTAGWVDLGPEIDMNGYKTLGAWITLDINDSFNARIRALAKHTSAGTEEYVIPIETISATDIKVGSTGYIEFDSDADQLSLIKLDTSNVIPFVQFQVMAETVGATAGQIDAAYITKGY